MPTPRRSKDDHLIYADVVDSDSKAGVWMGEREAFQANQSKIMEAVKDRTDWVSLKDAVMVITTDPAGITVIAANPTLPGMIVLADGGCPENSAKLQSMSEEVIRQVMADLGIAEEDAVA
ncbi:MAG: hypothetical protein ACRDT6_08670 [Micromonosporaceae bacterium]